jgi:hypothetical protein
MKTLPEVQQTLSIDWMTIQLETKTNSVSLMKRQNDEGRTSDAPGCDCSL